MPNHAIATAPRMRAGICAPLVPNAMRLITGNGTPVFSPMNPDRLSSRKRNTPPSVRASRICHPPRPSANSPMANE